MAQGKPHTVKTSGLLRDNAQPTSCENSTFQFQPCYKTSFALQGPKDQKDIWPGKK